jgi:hypothetical protein
MERRSNITRSGTPSGNVAAQERVEQLVDAATVTPNADSYNRGFLASLSQTTLIANPSGTPGNFQQYILRITSAASQTLTFGSQFRATSANPLPSSTTGSGATDYYGFHWNSTSSTWDQLAKSEGF